jgi:hypothetical protein
MTNIQSKDLDVRVRQRNLSSGKLDPKVLEKHLSQLPDLADACEPVSLEQPALAGIVDDED